MSAVGLVGDIGGTHARFALADVGEAGEIRLHHATALKAAEFPHLEAALSAYLEQVGHPKLAFLALACAGPVINGVVRFTNLAWTVAADSIALHFGVPNVVLVNDLGAFAWAAKELAPKDLREIGEVSTRRGGLLGGTVGIIGPGTGLNASALVAAPHAGQPLVCVGEAGHISFAPCDELDDQILCVLRRRFGRVSAERVVSGPGLLNLYEAVCEIEGATPTCPTPREVGERAAAGDRLAALAVERFMLCLATLAGDMVLTFGATGGLYIAGGVTLILIDLMNPVQFRQRFEDKGRFRDYLSAVPTFLIRHPYAALIGAARAALAAEASA